MKLTLDRLDLLPGSRDKNTSQIKFEDFTLEVQIAIAAVGRGMFEEFDRSSYNLVYADYSKLLDMPREK